MAKKLGQIIAGTGVSGQKGIGNEMRFGSSIKTIQKAAKKSTAIRNSTTMSDTEGNSDAEYDKPKKTKGQDGAGGDGAPNKLKAKVEDKSALTEEDFISIKFDREWPMII